MWCLTTIAVLFLAGTAHSVPLGPSHQRCSGKPDKPAAGNCLRALNMKAGDIITCPVCNPAKILGSKHYMLATGPDTIIHVVVRGVSPPKGIIKEMKFTEVYKGGYCFCHNWGKNYGCTGRDSAVAKAREYKDKIYYYNLLSCNCQHWVNKWTTGMGGLSTTSGAIWASTSCPAY